MGFLNVHTYTSLQEQDDGTTAFYPWGAFGSGYKLLSDEKEGEVRAFLKRYHKFTVPAGGLVGGVIGGLIVAAMEGLVSGTVVGASAAAAALLFAGAFWFYTARLRRLTDGLPVAETTFSAREAIRRQARAHSRLGLWVLEAIALGFVALGVWIVFYVGSVWIGVLSASFFGLCAAVFAYQLRLKARRERT